MALAALCAAIGGGHPVPVPPGTDCPAIARQYQAAIARVALAVTDETARDAIARVAYAEAGNQGDSGLAGVVYTILNRMVDGGFGTQLTAILDAPGQFEPVTKVHGWRNLPARTPVERAHIDTILNLALDGRLPDPTGGARFFQNRAIVAARAAQDVVPPGRVDFGGQKPVAVIGDQAFYSEGEGAGGRHASPPVSLFIPVQTAGAAVADADADTPERRAAPEPSQPPGLFIPLGR
jgi:hypothetical protein